MLHFAIHYKYILEMDLSDNLLTTFYITSTSNRLEICHEWKHFAREKIMYATNHTPSCLNAENFRYQFARLWHLLV